MESIERVKIVAEALDDKKASNIRILEIGELTSLGDYFVICSCTSSVQVKACTDEVQEQMEEAGYTVHHKEGYAGGNWVLMDYGDIIVHVMMEEAREFYDIERLWDEAKEITL